MNWKKSSVLTSRWSVYNIIGGQYWPQSSSTSAHDSFHENEISLVQHPDDAFMGLQRNIATVPEISHEQKMLLWTVTVVLWAWLRTLHLCDAGWCLVLRWHVSLDDLRHPLRRERTLTPGTMSRQSMHKWLLHEILQHTAFCVTSSDLVLDTTYIAEPAVINAVSQIEKLWQDQCDIYVSEGLINQTKRINFLLFSKPSVQVPIAALISKEWLFPVLQAVYCIADTWYLGEFFAH